MICYWICFSLTHSNHSDKRERADGYLYVVVDPTLNVRLAAAKSPRALPLDSIVCQTYISKQLGPVDQWLSRLEAARETGYNMVHLTPLQVLGSSNSAYSIKDHLKLSPLFNLSSAAGTVQYSMSGELKLPASSEL